jgi:hypothetical protein
MQIEPRTPTQGHWWLNATVGAWLALAAVTVVLAWQNGSLPGLYYDEAVFGGAAKEFVTGRARGTHMPGYSAVNLCGRPFPVFIQNYLGALKSWMLIPAIAAFGPKLSVLRYTTLAWGLVALFVFMLWVRRWQGDRIAVAAGVIMALDPAWFFLGVLDWGVAGPSFLCRFACFHFVRLWFREEKLRFAFSAAFFAGLGVFNKVDFLVLLAAVGAAGVACYAPLVRARLRARPVVAAVALAGFAASAGPILVNLAGIARDAATDPTTARDMLRQKLNTLSALCDGSYFYRTIDAGGLFHNTPASPSAWWHPFCLALAAGAAVLIAGVMACAWPPAMRRSASFVLLSCVLLTIGFLVLPRAVRLHHAAMIFPFPQLIIGMAIVLTWDRFAVPSFTYRLARGGLALGVLVLMGSQVLEIQRTERLISETGGRGRWSDSLDRFCAAVKDRGDLTIVSLDWGFNEQLIFFTEAPQLLEPMWFPEAVQDLPDRSDYLYLLHPPQYSLAEGNNVTLNAAAGLAAAKQVEIRPYLDRQNRVAFYAVRPLPRPGRTGTPAVAP